MHDKEFGDLNFLWEAETPTPHCAFESSHLDVKVVT